MKSPEQINQTLVDLGLWGKHGEPDAELQTRYAFHPGEPVAFNSYITDQMHEVAEAVPNALNFMTSSLDKGNDELEHQAKAGTNSYYVPATGELWHGNMTLPPVVMLDAMLSKDNELKIAEIDVINPRALGYLAMYEQLGYGADVANALDASAEWIQQHGGDITLMYGDMQRWYKPYFSFYKKALEERGLLAESVSESEMLDTEQLHGPNYLDLPILKRKGKKFIGKTLVQQCYDGEASFMYPPAPWLSSKVWLPYLAEQGILTDYLPQSFTATPELTEELGDNVGAYCIKAGVSSGMKGLYLPDTEQHGEALQNILKGNGSYIFQEYVDNKILELQHVKGSAWETDEFFARVSLFASPYSGKLLAADITGQPVSNGYNGVHGSSDCVLAPISVN